MPGGFSSETERELRRILKKHWSEDLHEALVAATTEYRRTASRQPTPDDTSIRDRIRRDLSQLEKSSSKAEAALNALDTGLRQEVIATTRPWWRFSFGTWMAGFPALRRYATYARAAVSSPAGRRPDPRKRRLAVVVEGAFRTRDIRISNTREGAYARTLDELLVAAGGDRGDHFHFLPAQRKRASPVAYPSPKAAVLLTPVAGWRYEHPVRLPSRRRAIQTALGQAGRLPRGVHLRLLADLTRAVMRFRHEQQPAARVRRHALGNRDYTALQRVVVSCDHLGKCLGHVAREHGLLDHYDDEWVFITGSRVPSDAWRDGLFLVSTECEALARQATTGSGGRPRAIDRDALALELAEILSRHGIELTASRTPQPSRDLLLHCLEVAGTSRPRDPYRLLRRVSDQLPTYAAARRRRRTHFAPLLGGSVSPR